MGTLELLYEIKRRLMDLDMDHNVDDDLVKIETAIEEYPTDEVR